MPDRRSGDDELVAIARRVIVTARIDLVALGSTPNKERQLWRLIDSMETFIRLNTHSLETELEQIDRELEGCLRGD